jgi:protein-disulfide isomerase
LNFAGLALLIALRPFDQSHSESKSDRLSRLGQWKVLGPIGAGSLILAVFSLKAMLEQFSYPASQIDEAVKTILESPPIAIQLNPEFPSMGPDNAPLTIVEFSDFQCPFCRIAAFTLHAISERYPHQLKIVFRNFPLNQSCNAQVNQTAHPIACEAAEIAICSHKQGKFKEVYEGLFEKQASFEPGLPVSIAQATGVDVATLRGCAGSPDTHFALSRDVEEATTLGIKSTPTFFINGHRIEGAIPISVWDQVIRHLLAQQP